MALTIAALLALAGPRAAHADEGALAKPKAAAAREHLASGNKLYRVREFDKAIEAYKSGALVEDAPVFHYNLGQCYRQLGRYEEAIWHYDRFIERGSPTGEVRAAVDAFRTQMKSELERKATKQPPTEPAPDPKPVPPKPVTKVVWVPGAPWYHDGVGWGLVASGLLAFGGSGLLFVNADDLEVDADKQTTQGAREELRDRAASRRTFGVIAGIGGAALLAGGIVKLALRPNGRERTITASLRVGFGADSVFVLGRF